MGETSLSKYLRNEYNTELLFKLTFHIRIVDSSIVIPQANNRPDLNRNLAIPVILILKSFGVSNVNKVVPLAVPSHGHTTYYQIGWGNQCQLALEQISYIRFFS